VKNINWPFLTAMLGLAFFWALAGVIMWRAVQ